MLVRVRDLRGSSTGPIAIVLDPETNQERLLPVSCDAATAIRVEFERESPKILAAAAGGFPVPEAIPFELDDDDSAGSSAADQ
jgi:hypothetical protein